MSDEAIPHVTVRAWVEEDGRVIVSAHEHMPSNGKCARGMALAELRDVLRVPLEKRPRLFRFMRLMAVREMCAARDGELSRVAGEA